MAAMALFCYHRDASNRMELQNTKQTEDATRFGRPEMLGYGARLTFIDVTMPVFTLRRMMLP